MLLGSKYWFAAHPTVPAKSMVADLNEDMFLPLVTLKVLTVYGSRNLTWVIATETAAKYGVRVQPDPAPLFNAFIRSDQYNFIRHGVPSLAMGFGVSNLAVERETFRVVHEPRYHAPSMIWHNQSIKALPESSQEHLSRDGSGCGERGRSSAMEARTVSFGGLPRGIDGRGLSSSGWWCSRRIPRPSLARAARSSGCRPVRKGRGPGD